MTDEFRSVLRPSRRAALALGLAGIVGPGVGRAAAEARIELPPSRSEVSVLPDVPIVRPQHVPRDEGQMFFAQNSINDNVLVYAARTTASGDLDPDEPATVYWRRYAEEGQRRELNFFERNFALGLSISSLGPGRWSVRMIAFREREILLDLGPDRRPRVTLMIDGRPTRPVYVWVEAYGSRFIPTIRHVDVYGRVDGATGVVRERVFFE